jgi:ATP phosphoribosyltransferase regulatory subunit
MAERDALRKLLGKGRSFVEPPILQDAELFLDLAGEDLRRRMFLTPSADGVELCLRPDYTIPVCLHHLTTGNPKRAGEYAYLGPVFRQRPGETGEFVQAGVESIGRADAPAADADALVLAREAVGLFGLDTPTIKLGDSALFASVLDALAIPNLWRRRFARAFGDPMRLRSVIQRAGGEGDEEAAAHAGFLAALDGVDHAAARRVVDDLLSIAGFTAFGGRSAAEIADRFLEQATLENGSGIGEAAVAVLDDYLAIGGDPASAASAVADLSRQAGLELGPVLDQFKKRNAALEKRGVDLKTIAFASDFGRRLDYYTGFVFELYDPRRAENPVAGLPVAGGGRYDRLLSRIAVRDGSGDDIPAVGFAVWLDRLEARR